MDQNMKTTKEYKRIEIAINDYTATRFELPLEISVQKKIDRKGSDRSDKLLSLCRHTKNICGTPAEMETENTGSNVI
jgi:hypothetical protein